MFRKTDYGHARASRIVKDIASLNKLRNDLLTDSLIDHRHYHVKIASFACCHALHCVWNGKTSNPPYVTIVPDG